MMGLIFCIFEGTEDVNLYSLFLMQEEPKEESDDDMGFSLFD